MKKLLLLTILLLSIYAPRAYAVDHNTLPNYGKVLVSGSSWMQGQGVDVYWSGGTGHWCGDKTPRERPDCYDYPGQYGSYKWQCVELAIRVYRSKGWMSGGWGVLYAYQIWSHPTSDQTTHGKSSGYIPVPGDLIIWDTGYGGIAGHVAVVDRYSNDIIYYCEQNSSSTGCGSFNRNSPPSKVLGYLHDDDNTLTNGTPDDQAPLISWGGSPVNRWYNDSGIQVATWSLSDSPRGVKGFGQAWDSDPGYQFDSSTGWLSLSGVGEGQHTVNVHAWDNAGNNSNNTHGWYGWDVTPPAVDITSGPPTGVWRNTSQRVSWHLTDGLSGVRGFGQAWDSVPSFQYGSVDGWLDPIEGSHTLHVHAYDNTDNGRGDGGNERDYTFGPYLLDTVPPVPSLTGPATSTWFRTPQAVTWDATDATSGIAAKTLTWDNGPATAISPAQIPEGKRNATIWAKDNALNEANQSYGPWWIDTTKPVPSAQFNPAAPNGQNGWYITDPTMSVAAIDPNGSDGSGVSGRFYALDGSAETSFTVPVTVSGDGIHTYNVRATDVAGNSGTGGDQVVRVDTTAPVFDSIYTDSESRSLNTLVATWSCSDPDSGIDEYQFWIGTTAGDDDVKGVTSAGANNWAYVLNLNLTPGQDYFFSVRARNVAGIWSGVVTSNAVLAIQGQHDASPSLNVGGVSVPEEARASTNYKIVDSIGQFVVATSESPSFVMEHGYWHSEITILQVATPGAAKAMENGRTLQIGTQDKPVVVMSSTSTFADRFYIESTDRSGGIACQYGAAGGPALVEGDRVCLIGKLNTVSDERMLQFASPTIVDHFDPLGPLYMNVPNLGGGYLNEWTPGVLDGVGLNNIGLLIKTYGGLVSYRDPQGRYFYLDNGDDLFDGSHYGMRIVCDGLVGGAKLAMPAYGKTIIVTGISSVVVINNQPVRAVRPRRQSDIQVMN